jgi:hypothetical protein
MPDLKKVFNDQEEMAMCCMVSILFRESASSQTKKTGAGEYYAGGPDTGHCNPAGEMFLIKNQAEEPGLQPAIAGRQRNYL